MKTHKFDVEDAKKHGVQKAILLTHLRFHQVNSLCIGDYYFDGHVWFHARRKEMEKVHPYFSGRSISRWLQELEKDGVIESRKPNAKGGEHTKFYRIIKQKNRGY